MSAETIETLLKLAPIAIQACWAVVSIALALACWTQYKDAKTADERLYKLIGKLAEDSKDERAETLAAQEKLVTALARVETVMDRYERRLDP